MKRRMLVIFTALVMLLTLCSSASAAVLPTEGENLSGTIIILHTNDSHGRMLKDDYNKQAGFTTVRAAKDAYEKAGAAVLLLDAGDTLHGLPIANLEKGKDVVSVMNEVGYDAMVPGNHDFNYGYERLLELTKSMKFSLLSANTIYSSSGESYLPSTTVIERNNVRFGIFGLTTPETAYKTNPIYVQNLTFGNPVLYAKKAVEQLKAQKVDYIIALSHIGVDASSEFTSDKIAAEVQGIDILIDGHSHTAMKNGAPVDSSITLVPHGDTLIASAGEYIENLGVVTIRPDKSKTAGLIAYDKELLVDSTIDALLDDIVKRQDILLSEVIGTTSVKLVGDRENARKEETNLGNLAADAIRSVSGAEVALTNGGGIRSSIDVGEITKKSIVTVFPFGNYVVTKKITGDSLLKALEHGVRSYPELSGGFPQVSGITFLIDESEPAGKRVKSVKINGRALDKKAEYILATNDFLAAGGDDYTMLGKYPNMNEYGSMEEILIEYIKSNPNVDMEIEGRIKVLEKAPEIEESENSQETLPPIPPKETTEPEDKGNSGLPAAGKTYVVRAGDNLWKIAVKYTGDGTN